MEETSKKLTDLLEAAYQKHAEDQIAGAIDALSGVIWFLKSEGAPSRHTLPLMWLADHVLGRRVGNSKQVFDAGRDGILVAAVDELVSMKLGLDDACSEASRAIGGEKSAESVLNLRKEVRRGKCNPKTREQYDAFKQELRNLLTDHSMLERRRAITEMLSSFYGISKV